MEEDDIKNAVIENVTIDTERGLTIWVWLNYGDSSQGFGGWLLYSPEGWRNKGRKVNYCGHYIWRLLEISGAKNLNDMSGKTVRARCTPEKVSAIGHIIKDDWFCPSKDFQVD